MKKATFLGLVTIITSFIACDQKDTSLLAPEPLLRAELEEPCYLPYGEPVPVGTELKCGPEPYDPEKHGPPLSDVAPHRNLILDPQEELPSRKGSAYPAFQPPLVARSPFVSAYGIEQRTRPDPGSLFSTTRPLVPPPPPENPGIPPGSGDRGFFVNVGDGICARDDIGLDVSIVHDNGTMYAPTHLPNGGSCLETVTLHWKRPDLFYTLHRHGFWNHCKAGYSSGYWDFIQPIDNFFRLYYARHLDGEEKLFSTVYKNTSGCWVGLLFNFQSGAWEQKTSVCQSQNRYPIGWTQWESYNMMSSCQYVASVESSQIQVRVSNQWRLANIYLSSQPDVGPRGYCWSGGGYSMQQDFITGGWIAYTP